MADDDRGFPWGQAEMLRYLLEQLIEFYDPLAVNAAITNTSLNTNATITNDRLGVYPYNPITTGDHDQLTLAGTGTYQLVTGSIPCEAVIVKSHPLNTGLVYVGLDGTTQANGFWLDENDSVSFRIDNVNKVRVCGDAIGDSLCWYCEIL